MTECRGIFKRGDELLVKPIQPPKDPYSTTFFSVPVDKKKFLLIGDTVVKIQPNGGSHPVLEWARGLKHLPQSSINTKTYRRAAFYLNQIFTGAFLKKKDIKKFITDKRWNLKVPVTLEAVEVGFRRLDKLFELRALKKGYSIADLIYSQHHPTGFLSPLLSTMTEEGWMEWCNAKGMELDGTPLKFFDDKVPLTALSTDPVKAEKLQFQRKTMIEKIKKLFIVTKFDVPLRKQLTFHIERLRKFYKFLPRPKSSQYTMKEVVQSSYGFVIDYLEFLSTKKSKFHPGVLNIKHPSFKEYLETVWPPETSGLVVPLTKVLDQFLEMELGPMKGKMDVEFIRKVSHFVEGQKVRLPLQKAQYYIQNNYAKEYRFS